MRVLFCELKFMAPEVKLTSVFHAALTAAGINQTDLKDAFAAWKTDWPEWEHLDYYFGKDGFYVDQVRGNLTSVRHVHMPPEDPINWPATAPALSPEKFIKIEKELLAWNRQWDLLEKSERRGIQLGKPWQPPSARYRVSSRVLVYVDGGRYGFLLLHLGIEPDGHDEATANKKLLKHWDDVAKAFIYNGTVIT